MKEKNTGLHSETSFSFDCKPTFSVALMSIIFKAAVKKFIKLAMALHPCANG